MAEREKLIELKDLQITFGSGKKKFVAVDHVNFDIYKGETFSLVGESGSGKTTIGRAICRINPTSGGDIFFKGINNLSVGFFAVGTKHRIAPESALHSFQINRESGNETGNTLFHVGKNLLILRRIEYVSNEIGHFNGFVFFEAASGHSRRA